MEEKLTPKQIRLRKEISQEEMAKSLNLSREHYQKIESNSIWFRRTKIDIAIKICEIGGITLNQLNFFY